MSTFKLKESKTKYVTEIKTLDETHKKIVSDFQKGKRMLPRKKRTLVDLQTKLLALESKNGSDYTNDDIRLRSTLKSDINALAEEIYDIENNISEIEYYSKTDDLLMDYYDILDHNDDNIYSHHPELSEIKIINNDSEYKFDKLDILNMANKQKKKQKKITRKRKRKVDVAPSHNILNFLSTPSNTINNNINTNTNNISMKDKSEILDNYRILTDNEYLCEKNKLKHLIRKCDECGVDKTLNQAEGSIVCLICGSSEMIIIESERPNYKDSVPDKPGYPYKRINHFNEWLSQFQAKESTEIPKETFDLILNELHKNRIYDLKKLTIPSTKKILKKLEITQHYEHTTHIISKLSGQPPPTISREIEEELRKMFKMIQLPFEKHCPRDRINFLSYSYVLHKFCQLLELDDFIKCFPLLKSREKLRQQDKIWEAICKELKWQFIPSI